LRLIVPDWPQRTGIPFEGEHMCSRPRAGSRSAKRPSPRRSLRSGARVGEGPGSARPPSRREGSIRGPGLVAGEPMPHSEFDPIELTKLTSR
jgi:hypothetical protein